MEPTQPAIQWVPGALSMGIQRPDREADHSPPSSAEVKEWVELYLDSPNTPSWRGAQLKHRDNFTFTLRGCIQKFPNWVDTEINNNKHSLRSNTKGYGDKIH
jgi:hypothetical protein